MGEKREMDKATITGDEELYDSYLILAAPLTSGPDVETDDETAAEHSRIAAALRELEPAIGWEIRQPRRGEAEGTYGVSEGRLPQILGCSIPVPERIERIIQDAWNRSIE